jgi:hypothetical protein
MLPKDTPKWMKRWDAMNIAIVIAVLLFVVWKSFFP